MLVCKSFRQVERCEIVIDYINCYENKNKIRRKSRYYRQCHIANILMDIYIVSIYCIYIL